MGNMRNHINTFTKSVKSAESVVNDLFDNCRESSTNRAFFCKTKPICRRCKIQVSSVVIKGYEGKARLAGISKQSQLKPKPMLRWVSLCGLNEVGPTRLSLLGRQVWLKMPLASLCRSSLHSPTSGERRLETGGIEPPFPRCDRGVLPLYHVPGFARIPYFSKPFLNSRIGITVVS